MLHYGIRHLKESDLPAIHAMRSEDSVMEMLEALPTQTLEDCQVLLDGLGNDKHCFVAVLEKPDGAVELLGMVLLQRYEGARREHSAALAITVRKDSQGKGIGKALMERILDFSDTWMLIRRIELTVFENNRSAIALYEKFGFVKEGLKQKSIIQNGQYADEWMMARVKSFG